MENFQDVNQHEDVHPIGVNMRIKGKKEYTFHTFFVKMSILSPLQFISHLSIPTPSPIQSQLLKIEIHVQFNPKCF